MSYKDNITSISKIPTYNDGKFEIFDIKQTENTYPIEYLHKEDVNKMWFKELSISDTVKFEADARGINIVMKIRIPQTKELSSMNVLKIGTEYYKVYNIYHFTDNYGFEQSDVTLQKYNNPKLEEDVQ